jgi:glyceraldehyde 3-phosphate dehydrogenase
MKLAINGFGRIGRIFFRQAYQQPDIEIVAVNDLGEKENLLYLLKYDSVYRRYEKDVSGIQFLQEKNPMKLPWGDLGIDVVVESTGVFTSYEKAKAHVDAGARRVVISAPADDAVDPELVGVNDDKFAHAKPITCNASCTTNSVASVLAILEEHVGIKKAGMITAHGYTANQNLVDGPNERDLRRGRAAAVNIVPSTTGAAKAVIQSLPILEGKFDAVAIRVPTITGSLSVVTALLEKETDVKYINSIFENAAQEDRWARVLKATHDLIVSADVIGEPYGAIIDLSLTKVIGGNLVKVFSWYDNEWGYCATLLEHVRRLAV